MKDDDPNKKNNAASDQSPTHDTNDLSGQEDTSDEEYQFESLDNLGSEAEPDMFSDAEINESATQGVEGVASSPSRGRLDSLDPDVLKTIRKIAVGVGVFAMVMLLYKYSSSFFSGEKKTKKISKVPTTQAMQKLSPKLEREPIVSPQQSNLPLVSAPPIQQTKSSTISKAEQKKLQQEVTNLQRQVNTVSEKVNSVADKMDDIKQTLLILNERLEKQSDEMSRLNQRVRSGRQASHSHKHATPKNIYYIQAIIPGRAWLISNDGQTLTVSSGTTVPGYGTVRMINPKIGRVYTSSGRVIQFSQADS